MSSNLVSQTLIDKLVEIPKHQRSVSIVSLITFALQVSEMSNSTSDTTLAAGETAQDLYDYIPSKTAAYAYLALFALSALAHFIMVFPLRAAFFIPLFLGCASKFQNSLP
jgi:hypothetical protein